MGAVLAQGHATSLLRRSLTGVEWVHGTAIGVARSSDGGLTWAYQGTLERLVPPETELPATLWAPDVVRIGDQWIMYLTVLGGVRTDWTGNAAIVQLASQDLVTWEYLGAVDLDSPRVIDAAVARRSSPLRRRPVPALVQGRSPRIQHLQYGEQHHCRSVVVGS